MKPTHPEQSQASRSSARIDRRSFLAFSATAISGAALAPGALRAAQDSPHPITRYPDPSVVALDPRFAKYKIGNAAIQRLWTGALWAEGCAWNGVGRYLVWSDIPNNRQMRLLDEDNHVSVFRKPSNYSNGNTFDFEGRQLSCEHDTRRVVRYEHSGSITVLADKWNGKPLNAPNDIVVHPDGGIWFNASGKNTCGISCLLCLGNWRYMALSRRDAYGNCCWLCWYRVRIVSGHLCWRN